MSRITVFIMRKGLLLQGRSISCVAWNPQKSCGNPFERSQGGIIFEKPTVEPVKAVECVCRAVTSEIGESAIQWIVGHIMETLEISDS